MKKTLIVLATCLASNLACAGTGIMTVTTDPSSDPTTQEVLNVAWQLGTGGTVNYQFIAKLTGTSCTTYCASDLGGLTCSVLKLDAQVYSDYNNYWNNAVACNLTNNKLDWAFFNEVQQAGGNKSYSLSESIQNAAATSTKTSVAITHLDLKK